MLKQYNKYIPLLFFVIIAFVLFANNGSISLWDQDEAAYAGFARNMIHSGNWLIPDFMWSEIHRKPPLHFWNICFSYMIFGVNEFSVRFPAALFLLLTYLLVYFAGTPLFGKKNAFLGTVVLSTTLFIPSLAKVSVTDSTLLFFSTVCAFALLNIIRQRSMKWTLAFWTAFALALLTKGPPVILFTGVFVVVLFLFHPDRKNLFSLHPWFFLPLACVPLFTWGYFVSQRDGGVFVNWMIDWYILKRVGGSVLGQTGPPGTHILSLFVFFLPYFMFFPKALWKAISSLFKKEKGIDFLLSAWFISGWFIYEWSPSKLPTYIITAHVPLAILIGKQVLENMKTGKLPAKGLMIAHFSISFLILGALIVTPVILQFPLLTEIDFAIAGLLLSGATAAVIYFRKSERFAPALVCTNLLFQLMIWVVLLPKADLLKNGTKNVASYISENAKPGSTIVIANDEGHPPSLPFYIGNHFEKTETHDDQPYLLSLLQSQKPYVLILDKEQKEFIESKWRGFKFEEIRSRLTDRNERSNYYIAINIAALKHDPE